MNEQSGQQPPQGESGNNPWELAAGWVDDVRVPAQEREAVARMNRYRPNILKKILAWTSVVFAALMTLTALVPSPDFGIRDVLGSLVMGLLFALPGLYWFYRTRQDRRTIQRWTDQHQQNEQMRQYLQGPELNLLGETDQVPLLPKRRWGRVILAEVGLFILFAMVIPPAV